MRYEKVGELARELGIVQSRINNLKAYMSKVTKLKIPIHIALFTEKVTEMAIYTTVDEDGDVGTYEQEVDKYAGIKIEYRLTQKTALEIAAVILRGLKKDEARAMAKIKGLGINMEV